MARQRPDSPVDVAVTRCPRLMVTAAGTPPGSSSRGEWCSRRGYHSWLPRREYAASVPNPARQGLFGNSFAIFLALDYAGSPTSVQAGEWSDTPA